MDSTNPYQAPRASLAVEPADDSYAAALRDFASTRLIIRAFAVLTACCSVIALSSTFAPTPYAPLFVVPAVLYVVHGVMHWRLASRIVEAVAKPGLSTIGSLLSALRTSWLASLALLAAGTLLTVTPALSALLGIGALSLESALTSSASNEAARLRTVLRLMLAAVASASVAIIWQQTHMPTPTGITLFAQALTVAVLGSYGLLVWQQLAPLQAFVAAPSPGTFRPLARAHRVLWVVLLITIGVFMACVLLALVMAFMVLPSELPDQR